MLGFERDLIIARISSGISRHKIVKQGKTLCVVVKSPDPYLKYRAQELYIDTLREAQSEGVMSDDDLVIWLCENNLWSATKEEQLAGITKDIDELKVQLYNLTLKSIERAKVRELLKNAKKVHRDLLQARHAYDYTTQAGVASLAKAGFILEQTTYIENEGRSSCSLLGDLFPCLYDEIVSSLSEGGLGEAEYREVARTEPWRSIWISSKGIPIFGNVLNYSDEQNSLVLWSRMYDNIYEHSECPHDSVIEDDDMLDGWLIIQRRKRESDLNRKIGEEALSKNPGIANAQEVFVMAETSEDAKKVEDLNSLSAKIIKAQRANALKKAGTLREDQLPDKALEIQMALNRR